MKRSYWREAALTAAGCAMFAAGFNIFILPLGLYSSGAVGLAQLAARAAAGVLPEQAGHVNLYGILFLLINIPIIIMARIRLGRRFLTRTVMGTVMLAVFSTCIPSPDHQIVSDTAVALVMGGVISGAGIGIVLTNGASCGGIEAAGLLLMKRFPRLTVGRLSLLFNCALFAVYILLFDTDTVICSFVYMVFYEIALDRLHYQDINVRLMIITDISGVDRMIMEKTGRGVTKWDGTGAYTGSGKDILVTVVNKQEAGMITDMVREMDPDSFTIIDEHVTVFGNLEHRT